MGDLVHGVSGLIFQRGREAAEAQEVRAEERWESGKSPLLLPPKENLRGRFMLFRSSSTNFHRSVSEQSSMEGGGEEEEEEEGFEEMLQKKLRDMHLLEFHSSFVF